MLSTRKLPVRPVIRTNICFFPISRQVYYADIYIHGFMELFRVIIINIFICLNYLDRVILRYICICQSHVFLCVFHYIASYCINTLFNGSG